MSIAFSPQENHRILAFQRAPPGLLCELIVGREPDDRSLEVVANICIRVHDVRKRAEIFWRMEKNGIKGTLVAFAFDHVAGGDLDVLIQKICEK